MQPWSRLRDELIASDPHCHQCGAEHGVTANLHYHHTTPRHRGTGCQKGVLLCERCHQAWHAEERRQHLQVNEKGFAITDYNPYKPRKKIRNREFEIRKMLAGYSC